MTESTDTKPQSVTGEVVAEQEVPEQDNEFARAALNSIQFRNLEGGTYKLVRVQDE